MLLLVAKSQTQLPDHLRIKSLVTPSNGAIPGAVWAADNEAFVGFDESKFVRMLTRLAGLDGCLFVAAPDVVGNALATFDLFDRWTHEIYTNYGLPAALVAQDGMTIKDYEWWSGAFDALFIGGSTRWKLSENARVLVTAAKRDGVWVHMGRVNSHRRLRLAKSWGVDSVDGTSMSMFSDAKLPQFLAASAYEQRSLDMLGGSDG